MNFLQQSFYEEISRNPFNSVEKFESEEAKKSFKLFILSTSCNQTETFPPISRKERVFNQRYLQKSQDTLKIK